MGAVVSMDDYRPHVTITTQANTVHVIPISLFEAIARGQLTVDALDMRDIIMRAVIAEWMDLIGVNGAQALREIED